MKNKNKLFIILLLVLLCMIFESSIVYAEETTTRKYLGEVTYAGKNDGYSLDETISKDNPHFGWELGNFFVSGFSRAIDEDKDTPIFLKNSDDKVSLSFNLSQDIEKLNGNDKLYITEDDGGYDEKLGVERTYFGKGMLITRHTDYQGKKGKPVLYKDYLKGVKTGADTSIMLCEEGDYEIVLDYKVGIDKDWWAIWEQSSFDYRIHFKFSVRNGNSMIFPRDSKTNSELTNSSCTENGFYLDLAKSRYLDLDVKKQVLNENSNGLVDDTRFNKPATDGDKFTDEGVYTITATNRYTNQTTTKIIYVGTNDLLKAYATTQLSLTEIQKQLEQGAKVSEDGKIIYTSNSSGLKATSDEINANSTTKNNTTDDNFIIAIIVGCVVLFLIIIVVIIVLKRKSNRNAKDIDNFDIE